MKLPGLILIGVGIVLIAMASCRSPNSDDANATMAVDESRVAPAADSNAIGVGPYWAFCKSNDPRGDPVIVMMADYPDKKNWPTAGKGYKKCTVDWAH